MDDWIKDLVGSLGYWGIAWLMFLENIVPPIPSEVIMPLAGFETAQGKLALAGVIAAGTAGSIIGQLPLYYLGKLAGAGRVASWADRYGKWLGVSATDIRRATEWFERRGALAVCLCRLIPGLRSLISVPAGIAKMGLGKFLAFSTLGMAVWTAVLALLGAQFGENYDQVEKYVGPVGLVVVGLLAVYFVTRAIRRWNRSGVPPSERPDLPDQKKAPGGDEESNQIEEPVVSSKTEGKTEDRSSGKRGRHRDEPEREHGEREED